ncbi:unnamed protein product [Gongylonema pulchrum]|uniref:Reverse transcriptase domain-containing protein n=1 Tax=Gongylonema pulchrum TaxID=637853 RepID=A0A183DRK8_9BILA|nr:unnamed protein product [Gongylonema pulchrum]
MYEGLINDALSTKVNGRQTRAALMGDEVMEEDNEYIDVEDGLQVLLKGRNMPKKFRLLLFDLLSLQKPIGFGHWK